MPHAPRRLARPTTVALIAGLLAGLSGLLGACASAAPASFDPTAACTADQKVAGAYPALEGRLPGSLFGVAPDTLDSGRNCTPRGLGTLANHGVTELRFAGAAWARGERGGVTTAVFEGEGVTPERIGEWYEAGARSATRTGNLRPSRPMVDGRQAYRLDLDVDGQAETVVVWPSPDGALVQVVLAVGAPAAEVEEAIAAFP